ncbi:MAG: peptidase U32 family protein [Bacteroidales bacterium]|nr:U32 family peptidase [Bacteroidales bacterium]MDY0215343.1 peptidase U32 family protein [Bacteroidales bacterium]
MNFPKKKIEIMSPVGSYESLHAAIQGGANSVYFGIGNLNMRSRSSANFTIDDLKTISEICKEHQIKSYLTLNTIIYNNEIEEMKQIANAAKENGINAVIASDTAVLQYLKSIGQEIHLSTQCNITNIEAVKFYSHFADVIVTARELSLKQVKEIVTQIQAENICGPSGNPIQIEIFVHGALCMAVSGKCYISLDNFGFSANRGACLQPCRRAYKVEDYDNEIELMVDNQYIMSPKDLCTIGFLDKIIDAGVSVFKIEGRGRSAEYVKTVTQCYREAADAVLDGTYDEAKKAHWMERLGKVYNRGFWDGYYLGRKVGEWTEKYGSLATRKKKYIGKVNNYFSKLSVAEIKIEASELNHKDEIIISGPTTGVYEDVLEEIRVDLKPTTKAKQGDVCSIPVKSEVRRNDKLYIWIENKEDVE